MLLADCHDVVKYLLADLIAESPLPTTIASAVRLLPVTFPLPPFGAYKIYGVSFTFNVPILVPVEDE